MITPKVIVFVFKSFIACALALRCFFVISALTYIGRTHYVKRIFKTRRYIAVIQKTYMKSVSDCFVNVSLNGNYTALNLFGKISADPFAVSDVIYTVFIY